MHNSAGPGHVSALSWDLHSPVMLRYLPTVVSGIETEILCELTSDSPSYGGRRAVADSCTGLGVLPLSGIVQGLLAPSYLSSLTQRRAPFQL